MKGSKRRLSVSRAYGWGVAVSLLTSFLILWTTVVRDDGNGIGSFMLIMAAAVGGAAAWFRPAGMARAMLGVAVMQALLGVALATAPSTVDTPGGAYKILVSSAVFIALWLVAAALFRSAARGDPNADASP